MKVAATTTLIVALAAPLGAAPEAQNAAGHGSHAYAPSFVEQVRRATEAFRDSRNVPQGYEAVLGCVSGPQEGAMGVHFVNSTLIGTLEIDQPQALIYEFKGAVGRLVGVEYIIP